MSLHNEYLSEIVIYDRIHRYFNILTIIELLKLTRSNKNVSTRKCTLNWLES